MKLSKFFIILMICVLAAFPGVAEEEHVHCSCFTQYVPTDPGLMFDPPVRMIVFGAPADNREFMIKFTASEAHNPMPEDSEGREKIIRVLGGEMTGLGTWSYTEPGVYHYTASMIDCGDAEYTYDTAVYTITDLVKAEGSALTLNRVITNKMKKQVRAMNFMIKHDTGQAAYSSPGTDSFSIIETKTENDQHNNHYYMLIGLGAVLVIAAAAELIRSFKKSVKRERYITWSQISAE